MKDMCERCFKHVAIVRVCGEDLCASCARKQAEEGFETTKRRNRV